jgi:hypothetical protein
MRTLSKSTGKNGKYRKRKIETAEVEAEIAKWDRFGLTQRRIVVKIQENLGIKISQPIVCRAIQRVRAEYRESALMHRNEMVVQEMKVLVDVRAEAIEAWERSKRNSRKVIRKKVPPRDCFKCKGTGAGGNKGPCKVCGGKKVIKFPPEVTSTVEGRLPASEYLNVIIQTNRAIRELLGLDEAIKLDVTTKSIDLNALLRDQYTLQENGRRAIVHPIDERTFAGIPDRVPEVIEGIHPKE